MATNYNMEFTRNLCGAEKYSGHSVEGITVGCPVVFKEIDASKPSRNAEHFTAIISLMYCKTIAINHLSSKAVSFDVFLPLAQHSMAVLQQRGSLGSTWKGAVAARWLYHKGERGSLPHPAPQVLLVGLLPNPQGWATSEQHRKFYCVSAEDCAFQKTFGFRLLSFPEGRIYILCTIFIYLINYLLV